MTAFTYQEIEFQISVKEGFYYYQQKVTPAYLVEGTGIDWAAIIVASLTRSIPNRSVVRLRTDHRQLHRDTEDDIAGMKPSNTPSPKSKRWDREAYEEGVDPYPKAKRKIMARLAVGCQPSAVSRQPLMKPNPRS